MRYIIRKIRRAFTRLKTISLGQGEYFVNGVNYKIHSDDNSHAVRRYKNDPNHLRFEVNEGECREKEFGLERSELSGGEGQFNHHEEINCSYEFRVISGTDLEGAKAVCGQFHAGIGSPNLSIRIIGNDRLKVYLRTGDAKDYTQLVPYSTTFEKDRWYKININVVFSSDPDGKVKIWIDDELVVNLSNLVTGYTQSNSNYWKFGIYRSTSHQSTMITEFRY